MKKRTDDDARTWLEADFAQFEAEMQALQRVRRRARDVRPTRRVTWTRRLWRRLHVRG